MQMSSFFGGGSGREGEGCNIAGGRTAVYAQCKSLLVGRLRLRENACRFDKTLVLDNWETTLPNDYRDGLKGGPQVP